MTITRKTKISSIIAQDASAIEIIASIHKNFSKLRNPVLRKLLAPRVTVEEAAKIGSVSAEFFLLRLEDAGFAVEKKFSPQASVPQKENFSAQNLEIVTEIDAREYLNNGSDPLRVISQGLNELEENETLLVVNSFEPTPLIRLFEKKGFEVGIVYTPHVVRTYFTKKDSFVKEKITQETNDSVQRKISSDEFEELVKNFSGNIIPLDVRGLEMPMPMIKILEESEKLYSGEALRVNHQRYPEFLVGELDRRKFQWKYYSEEGKTELLIWR